MNSPTKWVLLDTSYLVEIFRVPRLHELRAWSAITERMNQHIETDGRFYVTMPVVFEFANHIANINDGTARQKLALELESTVSASITMKKPWTFMPLGRVQKGQFVQEMIEVLKGLSSSFAAEYAAQGLGLTDVALVEAARFLRLEAAQQVPRALVHIWTRDAALKAREPDTEADAFV